jgi:hypothetical protein
MADGAILRRSVLSTQPHIGILDYSVIVTLLLVVIALLATLLTADLLVAVNPIVVCDVIEDLMWGGSGALPNDAGGATRIEKQSRHAAQRVQ